MQRRLHQIAVTWLLVAVVAGPWPILQSVAWVKMIVTFSQTETLSSAVTKTFSGKFACNLCKFVAKQKSAEKKQTAEHETLKLHFFLVENFTYTPWVDPIPGTVFLQERPNPLSYSPPTPPPRFA